MVTIGDVKFFLKDELHPFVWDRIKINKLMLFRKKGYFFHTMTDEKELDQDILNEINDYLQKSYHISLPSSFLLQDS